jgi:hypothetical protein
MDDRYSSLCWLYYHFCQFFVLKFKSGFPAHSDMCTPIVSPLNPCSSGYEVVYTGFPSLLIMAELAACNACKYFALFEGLGREANVWSCQ